MYPSLIQAYMCSPSIIPANVLHLGTYMRLRRKGSRRVLVSAVAKAARPTITTVAPPLLPLHLWTGNV